MVVLCALIALTSPTQKFRRASWKIRKKKKIPKSVTGKQSFFSHPALAGEIKEKCSHFDLLLITY